MGRPSFETAMGTDTAGSTKQFALTVRAQWDRSGERITYVRSSHHFEEGTHIRDRAGHGADNSDPGESASTRREMSRSRNTARSGLQSANSAKMRGDTDRASAIAADAAR